MSRSIRRAMIDRDHQQLSLVRQCILLEVSRASVYYRPVPTRAEDLELMALMDRQYLKTPFYGSRKMKAWLLQQGYLVSRKRVRRLMRLMGLEAIYRRPNTANAKSCRWQRRHIWTRYGGLQQVPMEGKKQQTAAACGDERAVGGSGARFGDQASAGRTRSRPGLGSRQLSTSAPPLPCIPINGEESTSPKAS